MGKSNPKSSSQPIAVKKASSKSSEVNAKHSLTNGKPTTLMPVPPVVSRTSHAHAAVASPPPPSSPAVISTPASKHHRDMGYTILSYLRSISGTAYRNSVTALKGDLMVLYGPNNDDGVGGDGGDKSYALKLVEVERTNGGASGRTVLQDAKIDNDDSSTSSSSSSSSGAVPPAAAARVKKRRRWLACSRKQNPSYSGG